MERALKDMIMPMNQFEQIDWQRKESIYMAKAMRQTIK